MTRSHGNGYRRLVKLAGGRRWPAAVSMLCAGWVLTGTAWPLDPHRHLTQFGHTAWRSQDGFVNGPGEIAQTADGYVWITTNDGLVRFDGVAFRPWSPPPGESLPSPSLNALLGTPDGSLWIGTSGGLSRLKDGHLFNYTTTPRSPGILAVVQDREGAIWVTRYRINDGLGPLCRVDGEHLRCYGKKDGLAATFGMGMAEQSDGSLWFACQMRVCRFAGGAFTSYFDEPLVDAAGGAGAIDVAADASGSVWASFDGVGPTLGVQRYALGKWAPFVVPGLDSSAVLSHTLFVDRQGVLWIGTESGGIYRVHDGHADHYDRSNGLSGNQVFAMIEDREGNVWVATDRGLDMFRDTPVLTYSTVEGLVGPAVTSVLALRDGTVWVGNEAGLSIIESGRVRSISPRQGLPGGDVDGLFQDSTGRVWAGVGTTVMSYASGRFSPIAGADGRPLAGARTATAFAEARNGDVWALTVDVPADEDHHLLRIRDRRVVEDVPVDPMVRRALFLAADPEEGVWVAGDTGHVARIRGGKADVSLRLESPEGPATVHGLSVHADAGVLFATSRGLYRWQDGRLGRLGSANGLPCASVYSAVRADDAAFWLFARCGLLRVPAEEWAAWLKAPGSSVSLDVFDFHDGAQPDTGVMKQPVVAKSPDGRLWFANRSNVQMIDPRRTHVNTVPPPVRVEAMIADGKVHGATGPVRLPPLPRRVEIDYTALSFRFPRKVLFRYQLEGLDADWHDAGVRRQALYNDLRPGRYRFRVVASNDAGVWNHEGATLDFTVEPAWFQTRWFVAAVAIGVLAAATGLYRMRVRQIARAMKARFDERLAERTRVARDLHDTLLQTVQGSKLVADHALRDPSDHGQLVRTVEQLAEWMARANREGRAALDSLRTTTSDPNDLADALRRALDECRVRENMDVSLSVVGEGRELHSVARDEIYRIGYEAIRNACRHSTGRTVDVTLEYARDLKLRVRDDGAGIAPSILEQGKARHFGLRGMRERAERIGGRLAIDTAEGSGTTVTLVVPGRVAFTTPSRPH